jgi:hypothetical protein
VDYQAVRPEKADGCPIAIDAAAIAELDDHGPASACIGLIARDPEVVVLVDFQTIGPAADPVD